MTRTLLFLGKYAPILLVGLAVLGLYLVGRANYLLFHALVEMFSIVVAASVFIIAWNTRRYLNNGYLLFIGVTHLFIAGLDLVHTLAYGGMGVFPDYDSNLPTQLWIASRYLHSFSMLAAVLFLRRKVRVDAVFAGYLGVSIVLLLSIFSWHNFPVAYVENVGLTPFKIVSEYVIALIFLSGIALLIRNQNEFEPRVLNLLVGSLIMNIIAELAFTGYVGVYDLANMSGHFAKLLAYYLVYKAIVETGFVAPYQLLFRSLKQNEEELSKARDDLEKRVIQRTAEVMSANQALQAEVLQHQRTEDELRRYREHLEELVEIRTAELTREIAERHRAEAQVQRYALELERSNRDLEDFASIASHDLQEPLRKITSFGDRLKTRAAEVLSAEERDYVERMQDASARMQRMINDLLAYSRVTARPQSFSQVDLNEIAAEVLSDLEVRIEETQGQVSVGDLPTLEADRLQMGQLLQNLVGNALKFHRPGVPPGVTIYASAVDGEAVPGGNGTGALQGGPMIQLFVEDNGIGFDETKAERIFHPFHRLVGKSQYAGTGMGLAICKKITTRHNGGITVRSTPGIGTCFVVTLPLSQPKDPEPG